MSGHIDASEDSEMVWECSPSCRRVAWKSVDSNSLLQLTSLAEKRKWVWGSIWKGEDECWRPLTFILYLRGSAESLVLWGSVVRICWLNLTLLSKALSFTLTSMGCSFQIESWHKTPEVPSKNFMNPCSSLTTVAMNQNMAYYLDLGQMYCWWVVCRKP